MHIQNRRQLENIRRYERGERGQCHCLGAYGPQPLLGFWASQQEFPAQGALLLLWVGFFALFRGISEIVVGFELRSRQRG